MPAWSRIAAIPFACWFGPAAISLWATILVVLMLDPAGDYPQTLAGPGLTLDEIFNTEIGVAIADPFLAGNVPKLIQAGRLLPDHPPLGRLWLGLAHEINLLIHPPTGEHDRIVVACARTGSAAAFGLLAFLLGSVSSLWYGRMAGCGTALAIVLMPRVFGQAHIAALETVLNVTYAAAFLSLACWWKPTSTTNSALTPQFPRFRMIILCGVLFGLALLTKIQAVFIPIPVALWALMNWRWRAIWPLLLWVLVGLTVFFVGWPWLWLDPVGHVLNYLGHAKERPTIYVWYLGRQFADRDVPWHYPCMLFATTIPAGLHLLGLWGLLVKTPGTLTTNPVARSSNGPVRNWLASREALIAGAILFPLFVFSLPGIAVYDGERLFSIVFPLWGLFIGRGLAAAYAWLARLMIPKLAGILLAGFLICQSPGLIRLSPCWLSYYNCLVGGLYGAEWLGFQTTYWGDSVTRELLFETANVVPAGSTIDFLPVQHPFQLAALESQCPILRTRQIKLRGFDERRPDPAKYLLVFQRRDYWPKDWPDGPQPYTLLSQVSREGVTLAALYERRE
ncbi:MAG: hypothetical protein JWM11_3158 [Planctomycetaceae bacterium]|nr:hypothetical protein [Planctomycetaceae bacterium]